MDLIFLDEDLAELLAELMGAEARHERLVVHYLGVVAAPVPVRGPARGLSVALRVGGIGETLDMAVAALPEP